MAQQNTTIFGLEPVLALTAINFILNLVGVILLISFAVAICAQKCHKRRLARQPFVSPVDADSSQY